ncbi:MAG: hypothetical protein M1825_000119 [Sarcosagium campestre]|nr:MAG: hypothetical protein M1825_000119 [Sarcosagium campestre]
MRIANRSVVSTGSRRSQARKSSQKRSLNALAIASSQQPQRSKTRGNRLGEIEEDDDRQSKRQKRTDDRHIADTQHSNGAESSSRPKRKGDDVDIEEGSDSEGNKWRLGDVDSEDDSDIDSDEALDASDEERFENFAFRGSQSTKSRRSLAVKGKKLPRTSETIDSGSSMDDELGDDGVDLAALLDESQSDDDDDDVDKNAVQRNGNQHVQGGEASNEGFGKGYFSEDGTDSAAEDDDDLQHASKLSSLRNLVESLHDTPSRDAAQDRPWSGAVEGNVPSEFSIPASKKLTVDDLIPSITDTRMKESLRLMVSSRSSKSGIKSTGVPSKLGVPLVKRQQDQLDRAAAYVKSKETLDRWVDTVKHNRRAEHLSFPLSDPNDPHSRQSERMRPPTVSAPITDLEGAIQNILKESGLQPSGGQDGEEKIRAHEQLQSNKMSLEEVKARQAQLRMARDLLFHEEKRAKQIKKIKSRAYRRVHRKQREREEADTQASLAAAGLSLPEDELERHDRRRAEERMGSRHKESRWARALKTSGRSAWDEDARSGVIEMAKRDEELRRRIEGRAVGYGDHDGSVLGSSDSSDDDGTYDDEALLRQLDKSSERRDDDLRKLGPSSKIASLKFMQRAEAGRKAENDAITADLRRELTSQTGQDSDSDDPKPVGRKLYGLATPQSTRSNMQSSQNIGEFEEAFDSDEADEPSQEVSSKTRASGAEVARKFSNPQSTQNRRSAMPSKDAAEGQSLHPNPFSSAKISPAYPVSAASLRQSQDEQGALRDRSPPDPENLQESLVDPNSGGKKDSSHTKSGTHEAKPDSENEQDSGVEEHGEVQSKTQQALILRAFAGDDDVKEFRQEKKQVIEHEEEKVIDNSLPGWGNWVGAGVSKKSIKTNSKSITRIGGIKADSRKDAKLDRVILNEKRNAKYLASALPHPFETREQYERSLRLPVGPEWTTKETFQSATKPRILYKRGVIAPMERPAL